MRSIFFQNNLSTRVIIFNFKESRWNEFDVEM